MGSIVVRSVAGTGTGRAMHTGTAMEQFRRITVAVADPADVELLRYAQQLARLAPHDITFRFVHVLGRSTSRLGVGPAANAAGGPGPGPLAAGATPRTHRAALEALRDAVVAHVDPAAARRCQVLTGDPLDQLLHDVAEWESDLLLIGHRRHTSGRRSTARRLAMNAPCSVWMVPAGTARPIARVLTAVDFSAPAAHALTAATLIANRLHATDCLAVHVRTAPTPAAASEPIARASDEQAFRRFLAPLDLHHVAVRTRIIEHDRIADAIVQLAGEEQADLIVAGIRGDSPSATLLLGSESEQLLLDASCPLLVTRARGERPGLLEALLDREFRSTPAR